MIRCAVHGAEGRRSIEIRNLTVLKGLNPHGIKDQGYVRAATLIKQETGKAVVSRHSSYLYSIDKGTPTAPTVRRQRGTRRFTVSGGGNYTEYKPNPDIIAAMAQAMQDNSSFGDLFLIESNGKLLTPKEWVQRQRIEKHDAEGVKDPKAFKRVSPQELDEFRRRGASISMASNRQKVQAAKAKAVGDGEPPVTSHRVESLHEEMFVVQVKTEGGRVVTTRMNRADRDQFMLHAVGARDAASGKEASPDRPKLAVKQADPWSRRMPDEAVADVFRNDVGAQWRIIDFVVERASDGHTTITDADFDAARQHVHRRINHVQAILARDGLQIYTRMRNVKIGVAAEGALLKKRYNQYFVRDVGELAQEKVIKWKKTKDLMT